MNSLPSRPSIGIVTATAVADSAITSTRRRITNRTTGV